MPAATRDQYTALLASHIRVFGEENPQTLITRAVLARWTGEAGDSAAARDQYAVLLPALIETLGGEHRETQAARGGQERWAGAAGDLVAARDCYARLLSVYDRLSGSDQPGNPGYPRQRRRITRGRRATRQRPATSTPKSRTPTSASHGPDSTLTLGTRSALARWTGEAGNPAAARDQYAEITDIQVRLHGPENIKAVLSADGPSPLDGEGRRPGSSPRPVRRNRGYRGTQVQTGKPSHAQRALGAGGLDRTGRRPGSSPRPVRRNRGYPGTQVRTRKPCHAQRALGASALDRAGRRPGGCP